ncbi:PREDICTED: leucine-rich repeat receptor protein kinase EMS1-like [Ipomoea nil]|uniref:leucine-rich repeat receptor protein kinase EMS1-like n=1 Tax=Ipomoea nil TaxID=35883 RepID=UPI000900E00B|nr:PREDICTED: leucine-rich repeat receptor protein kinase EMS1-like [Ipomoea nil]
MKHNTYNNIMVLLVFLLFICKFEYCYSNNGSCIEVERIALLRFKESLIDTSNRLSSWTGLDCCAWKGVSCGSVTGHVWKLDLHNLVTPTVTYDEDDDDEDDDDDDLSRVMSNYSNNCLRGEISHSLINLTYLNYLDLSWNNFSGIQIPKFLGSLKNLRYLNLSISGFVGNIPPHLGNLSRLEYLDLGNGDGVHHLWIVTNDLVTNNLDWLASLSSLKSLYMSSIPIQQSENLFGTINKLVSLSYLNLAFCGLEITNPPSSHVNSTSLISLDLSDNAWDAMAFVWLSNLTRLENLNLHYIHNLAFSFNSSQFIPFCKLLNLVSMDLSVNHIQGLIPHCFGNLTSLTSLNLASNRLEGSIPNSISRGLCRLQSLDLSENELSGSLTDSLGASSECLSYSLQLLFLNGNYFTGQLPNQLYMYKNLNRLYLYSNSLSGLISDSLGNLSMLSRLDISNNKFSGSIPSLGNLSMLSRLDISNNKFSGSIPTSLGQLSNLVELEIFNNSFQGILFESHFSKLTNLRVLDISENSLFLDVSSNWIPPFQLEHIEMYSIKVGPHFPQWLRTQTKLHSLSMSNASISDAIPDWFGNFFWTCSYIDLSKNNIRGELPMSVEVGYIGFDYFCRFKFSSNHLTGEIPKWLCNLKYLMVLDISSNKLSGEIPSCFGKLQELEYLDLGNNHLHGHIPNSLGSLSSLRSLHLQNNKFEGGLPSSFQNLGSLYTLDLSENGLMDVIPPWIGENLASLMFLNFQKNKFFGDIPLQLCYLKGLQLLNLANNNISGPIPRCFNNITTMVSDLDYSDYAFHVIFEENSDEDIKGLELEYTTNLEFLKSIDLSGNQITGEIPIEVMSLHALNNLNLSRNNLSGNIPHTIGNLSKIESLDLSMNALSGPIPQSLSSLNFLSYLNLSFNKLYGRIPTGPQLQTLDNPSIYIGNEGLCGVPLLKSCPGDDKPSFVKQPTETKLTNDDHEFLMWFYAGLGPGFFVGFIGVLCTLLFKRSWRYAYFKCLEITFNKVFCCISIKRNRR